MNFQKRKQAILKILDTAGASDIKSLAENIQVSEITIRRDLNQLAADGQLYRTHGGAQKVNPLELPHPFVNKAAANASVKEAICRRAAAEIKDGDIIFMDCGSTVFHLSQFIRNKKIRVITNSIPVIFELQNSQVALNIIGGEFDPERQAVHGSTAEFHIRQYRASKAFLGVDGISAKGLFANSEKEAGLTLALAAQSTHTYLLCDESKIGKETYLRFSGLDIIHTVITNAASNACKFLKKAAISVIRVSE